MNRKMLLLLMSSLIFSQSSPVFAASNPNITVKMNDIVHTYDQPPIMKNDRVFVPIRGIAEDSGAVVTYSAPDKKVMIQKENTTIEFMIGATSAKVNNEDKPIPESFIVNNRTMIPLRFVNEMLGFRVDWDGSNNLVSITTNRGFMVEKILDNSQKYLGVPYLYGGAFEKDGKFDCSSFVQKVYQESGVVLPRTSSDQSQLGMVVDLTKNQPLPGDLIFFDMNKENKVSHVAIYVNETTLLQSTTTLGVAYTPFSQYWKDRIFVVKDILQLD